MAKERIIGIDFGTSTSVMRVKQYENGQPVGDRLMTQAVTFDGGSTMTPTIIRECPNNTFYGQDAKMDRKASRLHSNFKMKLNSTNETVRNEARGMTEDFFGYLAKRYNALDESGAFGTAADQIKTCVSYPVKWPDEVKQFMLEAAQKAGFPNVEGVDEAQAAIQAIVAQNTDYIGKKFAGQKTLTVLVLDMGAGTTDLVLCRYDLTAKKAVMLCTWPKDGGITFGGQEVDDLLMRHVQETLPEEELPLILKRCGKNRFKEWKETIVSPMLARSERVDEFPHLDTLLETMEIEAQDYAFDRKQFEAMISHYMDQLTELVRGCLKEGKISGDSIDLVILTGGHSQWYFIRDILAGRYPNTPGLTKIGEDPERIFSTQLPQETVAIGLVLGKLADFAESRLVYREQIESTCTKEGVRACWMDMNTGKLYLDAEGKQEVDADELEMPKASHMLTWEVENGQRFKKCLTCGQVIMPLRHVQAVEPTCARKGHVEHWADDKNHRRYRDSEGTQEVKATDFFLPKKPHSWSETTIEGEVFRTCSVCGIKESVHFIPSSEQPKEQTVLVEDLPAPDDEFEIRLCEDIDYCMIVRYLGERKRVIIPETIQGKKIAYIGPGAFGRARFKRSQLEYVVIPATVKGIYMRAFLYCDKLETVVLPDKLEFIQEGVFRYCVRLATIRWETFKGENGIPGVAHFPKTMKKIAQNAFYKSGINQVLVSRETSTSLFGIGAQVRRVD